MQVFKVFFKLLNHYKGVIMMYFAIFLGVALVISDNGSAGEKEEEVTATTLNIAIIDLDGKTLGKALNTYFGSRHNLIETAYDEDAILEELYWRKLGYVLIIPEGFEAALLSEDAENMELNSMKVPGTWTADYFESELALYMSKLTALLKSGYPLEEAQSVLQDLQQHKAKVSLANFVNENQNDRCTMFFIYAPYLFLALGVQGVGIILIHLNEREVKARMECSALPMKNRIGGLTAGILVYGVILLGTVIVIAGILSKGSIYGDVRFPYFLLNLTGMLLLGLSIGFLAGTVARNSDALNGIVNVVSLVLCFLGGVFVKQELFSDAITKAARFVPTYWYVNTNDAIGAMQTMNQELLQKILLQVGLVACYALAIFAITVVIISSQRKRIG